MKLYTITNNAYGYVNTIMIKDNTVIALSENGSNAIIELRRNKSHVLKFNKKSISTCNVEMLVHAIKSNTDNFINVFAYVFDHAIYAPGTFDKYNVTRPAFYATFNNNLNSFIELFKNCSSSTRQTIISDHICYDHDAKMHGVISLSTYIGLNTFCRARCKNCDNAICKYCYAASLTAQRAGLKNKLRRIHAILTNVALTAMDIPKLDSNLYPYFRFESFGDINNVLQVKNYNLIAAVNSDINFTWWTKNPGIIQNAIDNGMTLSKNIVIGLSSLYLNKPEIDKAQRYSFIRFLFTVYDDKYIEDNDVIINCGAKHCISCGICYKYLHEFRHGLQLINERKK